MSEQEYAKAAHARGNPGVLIPGIVAASTPFIEAPMHSPGLYPEHDILIQLMKLNHTFHWTRGKDLIPHLGLEYYN